jgi:hypothetical protein
MMTVLMGSIVHLLKVPSARQAQVQLLATPLPGNSPSPPGMVSLKVGCKEIMPGTIALNVSASLTEKIVPFQVLGAAGALYLVYNKRHQKGEETGPLLQLMQVPCLLKCIKTSIEVVGRVKMSKMSKKLLVQEF